MCRLNGWPGVIALNRIMASRRARLERGRRAARRQQPVLDPAIKSLKDEGFDQDFAHSAEGFSGVVVLKSAASADCCAFRRG